MGLSDSATWRPQAEHICVDEGLEGLVDFRIYVGSDAHVGADGILRTVLSGNGVAGVAFIDDDLKLNKYLYNSRFKNFDGVPEYWAERVIPAVEIETKMDRGSENIFPYTLVGYGVNIHDKALQEMWEDSKRNWSPTCQEASEVIRAAGGITTFIPARSDYMGIDAENEWLVEQDWVDAVELWTRERPPYGSLEFRLITSGKLATAGSGSAFWSEIFIPYTESEKVDDEKVSPFLKTISEKNGFLAQA